MDIVNKKGFHYFDIFKFIFAIFVIGIHTSLLKNSPSNFSWYITHGLFRIAVPSFFVISGFFYGKKIYKKSDQERKEITIKYVKRLLIPFFFWLLLNLPFKFIEYHKTLSVMGTIKILLRDLVFYPWGALWYISSLIVAVLLINLLLKKMSTKKIIIIGMVLYLFALICNNYYFLVQNNFIGKIIDTYMKICESGRNGVFVGLLFVSLGVGVYQLFIENKIKYRLCFIGMILSYGLLIGEIFLIKGKLYLDDGSLYIMLVIFIPLFIAYFSKYQSTLDTTFVRKLSTGIYYSHRFIIKICELILPLLIINYSKTLLFFCTLGLTVLLVIIMYFINNKCVNKIMF